VYAKQILFQTYRMPFIENLKKSESEELYLESTTLKQLIEITQKG